MILGKKILLIIGGGISAYKSAELIRLLSKNGAEVVTALTKAGSSFVTPLTLTVLSKNKVYQDIFDLQSETEIGHIELSRAADLIVVAPGTADLLAKMASGLANDLATTLLLATDTQVLVAPAMNVRMWEHAATIRNVEMLINDGISFVGPDQGDMACGEYGYGRMSEPADILASIIAHFERGPLRGRHVLMTSGPTHEPIDPVRYIANRSSGKQGSAIAKELIRQGAKVSFITGPATADRPQNTDIIEVQTAVEMQNAVNSIENVDIAIFVAAVADWRVSTFADEKIKKTKDGDLPSLKFVENPDILRSYSMKTEGRPELVIGFAAETERVLEFAKTKLEKKGCDWILANDVSAGSGVMGGDHNKIILVTQENVEEWPEMNKENVAKTLVAKIIEALA